MHLADRTIRDAFRMHAEIYATMKGWDIPYHIDCWNRAHAAFAGGSRADFDWLYKELKNRWQVFRGARTAPWTAGQTFKALSDLDGRLRALRLSELRSEHLDSCWAAIDAISGVKPTKYAPSVVAISKFLHIMNPRLFVIVDDAIMWRWVFAHGWLKRQVRAKRAEVQALLPDARCPNARGSCDLLSYLAVLWWSADVVGRHPSIAGRFVAHVEAHAGDKAINVPLEEYEAVAIEWLLMGLVALPPNGVTLTGD